MTQSAVSEAGHNGKMCVLECLPKDLHKKCFGAVEEGNEQIIARLFAELGARPSATGSAPDAYGPRISYLRDEAAHDGYELNVNSERDFRQFVRSRPSIRKGGLVLLDNGNLRAVWKDEQGGHLGLQFLGRRKVQCVIFRRRKKEQGISRFSGRDTMEGIDRLIEAFELHSLLAE